MEERVTGKDLWCALQIVRNVERRIDTACAYTECDQCPMDGLFDVDFCAETDHTDSEERAKLLIKMLEQMEEPKND